MLFHIPHPAFTDQNTWWRFGVLDVGFRGTNNAYSASRTGIHPTTELHSKNLDFHPVYLARNCKNQNDASGLRALVPVPGLDDKD
ncbi:hypothetical protein TNCV_4549881 [Trichonephila clavipes]|nr:hypothetical protein TNCV_4549881 [Trichonephila clavipes]